MATKKQQSWQRSGHFWNQFRSGLKKPQQPSQAKPEKLPSVLYSMTPFRGRGSEDWLSSPNLHVHHLSAHTDINTVIHLSKLIICTNVLTDYSDVLAGTFGMPDKVVSTEGAVAVCSWPGCCVELLLWSGQPWQCPAKWGRGEKQSCFQRILDDL